MSWRTAAFLCAGRLSMTTMSPGDKVGSRHCRTYSTKIAPVIARSMTNGAVIALWRKPATKVIVFQWPHGTRPTTRRPRFARPRSPRHVGRSAGFIDEDQPCRSPGKRSSGSVPGTGASGAPEAHNVVTVAIARELAAFRLGHRYCCNAVLKPPEPLDPRRRKRQGDRT